jgi:glycosyltransferase involved in cell wall biosynthesis
LSFKRILDHRQIAGKFSALARREERKPDIILASLPTIELSLAAVRHGRENGVPVVLDIRDMWPDIFVEAVPVVLRPLARILLIPMFRDARTACAGATAITGAIEGFVPWGLKRGGRLRTGLDRAFPMGYVTRPPADQQILAAERHWDGLGVLEEDAHRTLCFIGTLGRQFDIETVLSAATECSRQNLFWRFVFCGASDRLEEYKKKAQGVGNVFFPGWVNSAQIHVLMRRPAVGLNPLLAGC